MLEKDELLKINGGAVSAGVVALISGIVVFIIGVIDGYVRPLPCR